MHAHMCVWGASKPSFCAPRLQQGKTRTTAFGSTYRAPPSILHGYSKAVTGNTASERLDLRCVGGSLGHRQPSTCTSNVCTARRACMCSSCSHQPSHAHVTTAPTPPPTPHAQSRIQERQGATQRAPANRVYACMGTSLQPTLSGQVGAARDPALLPSLSATVPRPSTARATVRQVTWPAGCLGSPGRRRPAAKQPALPGKHGCARPRGS